MVISWITHRRFISSEVTSQNVCGINHNVLKMKGESVSNLSKYYSIPKTSIYNWIDKHSDKSIQELTTSKRQIYDYQRMIEKLNRENQIQQYIIANLDIAKKTRLIWYTYWKKSNIQSKQFVEYLI